MRSRLLRTITFTIIASCLLVVLDPVNGVNERGESAFRAALSRLGRPYRFTGSGPREFDCSGLVRYSYLTEGLDLPHRTAELRQVAQAVPADEIRKGDLLFFRQNGRNFSHVGIYAGEGLFIHAASTARSVRLDSLQDAYWKEHFLEARRP